MIGKKRSVARDIVKSLSEVRVGDKYVEAETSDTHGVLGLAIYENTTPLVLHQKIGDAELIEATEVDRFFRLYTPT